MTNKDGVMRTAAELSLLLLGLASLTVLFPEGIFCIGRRASCAESSTAEHLFRTYNAHRELIASENEMINHRMMWLLTMEGLLFASFFLVWRGKRETKGEKSVHTTELCILYLLGVFSAVSVGLVLFYGSNTIRCIVRNTPQAGRSYVRGVRHVIGEEHVIDMRRGLHSVLAWLVSVLGNYLLPWHSLPAVFVVAWYWLLKEYRH